MYKIRERVEIYTLCTSLFIVITTLGLPHGVVIYLPFQKIRLDPKGAIIVQYCRTNTIVVLQSSFYLKTL